VPHRVLREFSRRRVEIEAAMAERGSTSRAGAQAATLATRKAKDYGARPESLAAEWHARADALGFDAAARTRLLGRLPARLPEPADLLRASAELLSPAGLTGKASAFTRPDATRGWCVRLPQGAPRARTHMHAAAFLARPSLTVPVGRYTDRTFTSGDLVIARRNDYRLGLVNGQRGVVAGVDPSLSTLTVRIAGRDLSVDAGTCATAAWTTATP